LTKTLWVLFLVFLPFVAAFVYLIVRGEGIAERSAAQQQRAQEQFAGYVRNVAANGDATPTEQIARAKELTMGPHYRHATPEMASRVVAAIQTRLAVVGKFLEHVQ
jgi:hypothetical protein